MRLLLLSLLLMAEFIGDIEIPEPPSGSDFPLVSDYPHAVSQDYRVQVHTFGSSNRKIEQRYLLGTGARKFTVQRAYMNLTERNALRDHWEANKGGYQQFTYNAPSTDQASTVAYTVRYANEPLVWEVRGPKTFGCRIVLVEVPSAGSAPSYSVTATVTRFPAGGLAAALLGQEQLLIPLLKIQPKESGYSAIYLSDRRVTVAGQLYQSRLTNWDGISQTVGSASDDAGFSFGNADLVFTQLANDVDLMRASIEFSLLHLSALDGSGTNTKIDLWKGEVVSWQDDEGSPDFTVRASDGIYELRLPYPVRKISRTCWKDLGGGPCSWTNGVQGRDLVHFPSASTTECDKGYDTPNGCLAHNNKREFGGMIAEPQGAFIKDNATGTWGIGRNGITSTSIIADSAYEKPVREVYTDSDMPVACDVIAGRDESDFYEALGIVGEGPITFATPGPLKYHTLDGSPHHGHPGSLGLRTIPGTDPAGLTDFLSLDQSGNQTGGDFRKVYSGNSTYKDNFAAGLAALVIRRVDEKGLQLTRPTDHQMTAIVSGGLQGYVWSGAGSRSLQTLTNPVWIAVNMLLRARGLQFASAATCEQYFDVTAAIAAANICDASVSKIAGLSGTETQFKFRGVVQDEKPLRDWVDEVLTNCLGYYTFAFGKLKIGIRINSSTVEAFTVGNTIADSLRLAPVQVGVNDLTGVFADEAFDYQTNSVNVYAIDHKKLVGGAASPLSLKQTLNLSGTSGASQAARIVATRLKEEMGGATLAEWRKARVVQFRTTILALNVEPGMVCSMTHESMPDGAGEFRVLGWRLNRDMSIDIEGKTTTDAMYDATAGPKPADVVPALPPVEQVQYPRRPGWMAGDNQGSVSDPIQGANEFSIRVAERYEDKADGSKQALVAVHGFAPRNRFLNVPPPIIRGLTPSTSSGSVPAGNWWVSVAPYQGNRFGPPSNVLAAALSGTGKLTIGSITWPQPPFGSWDGYAWMLGDSEQSMCQNDVAGSLPSSIDITVERRFSQALQPNISKITAKVKLCPWPGIVRGAVSAVTSTTIVVDGFAGGGDAFSGRRVQIISDDSDGQPGVWNFACSSYDEATGTFTVTPNPVSAGVGIGDMLVVLTSPSSVTSTGYSDTAYNFTTDQAKGYVARILHGKGRGQARTIIANTATAITVEPAWDVNPDSSSVIVIEEAGWGYSATSGEIESESGLEIAIDVPTDNLAGAVLLVAGFGVDRFDTEAPESATPMRVLFIKGEAATGGPDDIPEDVVPIGANDFEINVDLDYSAGVGVPQQAFSFEYDVVDPIDSIAGVTVYVVTPDGRVQEVGSPPYNGDPGGVGAARYGTFTITLPLASSAGEDWDFYLASWSATYRKPLDIATTPKRTIAALSAQVGLVTSFSILAGYGDDGSVLLVAPSFTPPADPNFWYAEIWMKTPYWEGQLGEADGSDIIFTVGGGFPPTPPGTNETWDFYAVSVGRDQTKNPPAFNIASPTGAAHATAVISPQPVAGSAPALPSAVVGSHIASGQDATTPQLRVKLRATITYPLGSTATIVQIWLSMDNGATWEFAVNDEAAATVDFWWPAPAATVTTAKLKVITANEYGWNDPASAVVSAAFTITAGQTVSATAITDAVQVGPLVYLQNADGQWVWGWKVQWTNPPSSNANFFTTKLYVRKIDFSGNPATDWEGELREVGQRGDPGIVVTMAEGGWRTPVAGELYKYFALYLYCVNQTFQETLQTTAWSGNPYKLLAPVEPIGSSGEQYAPLVTSQSATVTYTTDEQGALVFRFQGSFTPPNNPGYGGCMIVARTAGGVDIPVATVQQSATSFVGPPMPVPEAGETYAVYFVSVDTFNRANSLVPGTTPRVTGVSVSRTPGSSGQENAPLVTGFTATAAVGYYGEDGAQRYQFSGTLTPPAGGKYKGLLVKACLKGTVGAVNGSAIYTRVTGQYFFSHHVNQKIDVAGVQMTITSVLSPTQVLTNVAWSSSTATWVVVFLTEARIVADIGPTDTFWSSLRYEVNHDSEDWRLYAISYDYSGRENTLVPGSTPSADVTVSRLTGTTGQEYTDVVTGVTSTETSPGIKCIVINNEMGETQWLVSGQFTQPTGARAALYGGTKVCRLNPANPDGSIVIDDVKDSGTGIGSYRSSLQPTLGATNIPIIFLSYDTSGRVNRYQAGVTPEYTAITPGQSASLRLDKIDPATMNVAPIASYILPPMNLPSLPSLPSAQYPKGRLVYRTSDNTQWRVAESGLTWDSIPLGNSAFFKSVTANQMAVGAIGTFELAAQEIIVGSPSGGGGATKFRVNDSFGAMVCAIGDFGTFKGFHAINARIGPNINDPNFYADGVQVYLKDVRFTQNLGNNVVVSIRNDSTVSGLAGLMVHDSSFGNAVTISPGNLYMLATTTAGPIRARLYWNTIQAALELNNQFGQNVIYLGGFGGATVNLREAGGALRSGYDGTLQVSVPGGTRTLRFTAGWVTGVDIP